MYCWILRRGTKGGGRSGGKFEREREREGEGIVCWRTRVSRISGRKGVVRLRESVIETRREVKRGEDNVIVE